MYSADDSNRNPECKNTGGVVNPLCQGTVPSLKEAVQIGRETEDTPVAQAAARAIATACGSIRTPTNAFGFLLYGAAAVAYSKAGLLQTAAVYDELATEELRQALNSLRQIAVPDETHPAKINWNC